MIFRILPRHIKPDFPSEWTVNTYYNIRYDILGYTATKWKKNQKEPAFSKAYFSVRDGTIQEKWPAILPIYGMEQKRTNQANIHGTEHLAREYRALQPDVTHLSFPGGLKRIHQVDFSYLGHFPILYNCIQNPDLFCQFECQLHNQNIKHHNNRILVQKTGKGDYDAILTFNNQFYGFYLNSGEYHYANITKELQPQ